MLTGEGWTLLGVLKLDSRGWGRAERDSLYGLPVLCSRADPVGWLGEFRLRRAGRALHCGGAVHTLAPQGFDRWPLLEAWGLRPVDPLPLVRAQSVPLALTAMARQGLDPGRGVVALRGARADRDMERTAQALCPLVRRLIIDAPRGGEELSRRLRWEYGIPILPPEEGGQVALCFSPVVQQPEKAVLSLYGPRPDLGDLTLSAPMLKEEDQTDLPLLAALWEGGCLESSRLKIT